MRSPGAVGLVGVLACAALVAFSLAWAPEVRAQEAADAAARSVTDALREGNRLFAQGDLEGALRAYQAGFRPEAPHPTLVYNTATTLHHLERLPEAMLWYRRGDAEDPWLQENLWLARRSLGSQRLGISGLAAFMAKRSGLLFGAAVALAWLSLLAALWQRLPRRVWASALGLALLLWLSSWLVARSAPREAVLLDDCAAAAGELPAGTELWFWPSEGETLAVVGFAETSCSAQAIGWIRP